MRYFSVEPEVAGGIGERTILDVSVHPPIVSKLHYEIEGWPEDAILEGFPVFIVTEAVKRGLIESRLTGAAFAEAEVTTSENFREFYPDRQLPPFVWLKPIGRAGRDDFGTTSKGYLVVSERALDVLRKFGIENALVSPFD